MLVNVIFKAVIFLPIFSLGGTILLFFLPVILSESLWGFRDFHRYVYPLRYFGRECIRDFVIPFWNPFVGCGTPFFAGLQGCVFYPPSILVYLLPYEIGLKAYIIFHFLLCAISSYILGRHLNLDKASSFVLSITFSFSGWLVSSIDIPIILGSSSLLPLIFIFFLRSSFILTGVFLSFQFLAGEPSMFYLTSILIFLFSIFTRKIKIGILSILIGISFSLFQILPFLEFLSLSTRVSQGYAEGVKWAFAPYELFKFILPSSCGAIVRGEEEPFLWFGQMWLKSPYLGIIPFLLALIALLYPRKEKILLFFSFSFLFFLIISLGDYTPLYKILYPLFSLMRYPVKFLYIATFSLSVLAGFGTSYILDKKINPIKAFIYIGLFICLAFIILSIKKNELFSLFPSISTIQLIKWWNMLYSDGIFILFVIFFSIISLLLYLFEIIKRNTFIIAFIGLIIIDLFFFQQELNPLVKSSVYKKSNTVRFFEEHKGIFRICLSPRTAQYFTMIRGKTLGEAIENSKRFVVPNIGIPFGIYEAGNYDSLYLSSYFSLREEMAKKPFSDISKLLSLMNIRFIVSKDRLFEKEIRLVYQDRDMFIYENPFFHKRAFFVPRAIVVDNPFEYILSAKFNPEEEVVLEEEPEENQKSKIKNQNCGEDLIKIVRYEPNRVTIEVEAKEGGFLFLSDTYYPGWKAFIDKKQTKIYRANYCFRAIKIDKGRHIVEFRYFPKTFIIGLLGSLVSFSLVILFSFRKFKLQQYLQAFQALQ